MTKLSKQIHMRELQITKPVVRAPMASYCHIYLVNLYYHQQTYLITLINKYRLIENNRNYWLIKYVYHTITNIIEFDKPINLCYRK